MHYPNFEKWAFENGYDPDAGRGLCTIDRIDVNGDYSPDNCRFVDVKEQNRNRRCNRITVGSNGSEHRTMEEAARAAKVSSRTMRYRIERGIPVDGVVYRFADQD